MPNLIDDAQTVLKIIRDSSLPTGERLRKAVRLIAEASPAEFDESLGGLPAHLDETDEAVARMNEIIQRRGSDVDPTLAAECKRKLAAVEQERQQLIDLIESYASRFAESAASRIMAELDAGVDRLPEVAILMAREHRQLIVPRLFQALRDAVAGARRGELPQGNAHFFAAYLLTEFKVAEAFPLLLEALTLPEDLPDELFGDAVHELPSRIFALFLGDRIDQIAALVDDRSLDYSPRWNAAHCYMYLVRDGRLNREEAVGRLQRHLRRAIDGGDENILTPLIIELSYYSPAEAIETIREAYQRGLVDGFISLKEIEEDIAKGEPGLGKQLARCPSLDVDTLAELSRWAGFAYKSNAGADDDPPAPPPKPTARPHSAGTAAGLEALHEPLVSRGPRVGRNDPCPCGSGKKFKKCCGSRRG